MPSTKRRTEDRKLVKGPNGRNLCRYCKTEVSPPRFTFCSDACVHEWSLRARPAYARQCVEKRDRGVCAECGLNTERERVRLFKVHHRDPEDALAAYETMRAQGWPKNFFRRLSWWDADHINPVVEGGGECGLENLRTLCLRCHSLASAALAARLKEKRRIEAGQGELL